MKKLAILIAIATFVAGAVTGTAQEFAVDAAHSEVSFQVRHILTKVRGGFDLYEGRIAFDRDRPERSSVRFTIDATSINTKVEKRDEHLRSPDFFAVDEFPRITFSSTKIAPLGADGHFAVTGDLTIRGVTKSVTLPVEFYGTASDPWGGVRAGFATEVMLNRKDFGIVWNSTLDQGGTVLGDEVSVAINIEAIQQSKKEPSR